MLKTLVRAGALLLIGAFFIVATAGASSSPADEFTIPQDKYVTLSNNLTIHLIQVTISNITYGGAYAPDPVNASWPVLVFQYENHGNYQAPCRFHVQIVDNTSTVPPGWKYDKTDETIPQPIYPGHVSQTVTLEFAMPKSRTLTNVTVIDDELHKKVADFPIIYPTPTPVPTAIPDPGSITEGDNLRNLMLIPILLGVVGLIGWYMAKKRLF